MRKKYQPVPFETDSERVTVPSDKRVTNVNVIEVDGYEQVEIFVESKPQIPAKYLAAVVVER